MMPPSTEHACTVPYSMGSPVVVSKRVYTILSQRTVSTPTAQKTVAKDLTTAERVLVGCSWGAQGGFGGGDRPEPDGLEADPGKGPAAFEDHGDECLHR